MCPRFCVLVIEMGFPDTIVPDLEEKHFRVVLSNVLDRVAARRHDHCCLGLGLYYPLRPRICLWCWVYEVRTVAWKVAVCSDLHFAATDDVYIVFGAPVRDVLLACFKCHVH